MDLHLIERSVSDIEDGITKMLERYLWLRSKINSTHAYSKSETQERLELMKELAYLGIYLRMLDIQDFEIKDTWINFKIR